LRLVLCAGDSLLLRKLAIFKSRLPFARLAGSFLVHKGTQGSAEDGNTHNQVYRTMSKVTGSFVEVHSLTIANKTHKNTWLQLIQKKKAKNATLLITSTKLTSIENHPILTRRSRGVYPHRTPPAVAAAAAAAASALQSGLCCFQAARWQARPQ
jgi:hypothetical protein